MSVRTLRYVIAIALCLIFAAGAVNAVSFTYSSQAKRIKAGVIILPDTAVTGEGRPNPYIFYVMDQRTDLKPSGWDFYNPFAPSQVTGDIAGRWLITPTTSTYILGETVDKSMGCYWEVPINLMSPENLAEYDVLFLSNYTAPAGIAPTFTGRDREKLRKFVDNGGVLWVDYERTLPAIPLLDLYTKLYSMPAGNTFFVDSVNFAGGGAGTGVLAIVPPRTRFHSLLNRPFFLSQTDIQLLGGYGPANQANTEYVDLAIGSFAANVFVPIVTRGPNTTIYASQYGSGYVVVTADNVGQAVTNPVGAEVVPNTTTLTGRCTKMFIAAQPEDLKFAYNIVNWGSEHSTFHKNARRTGASFAEIGMPLVPLWSYKATTTAAPTDSSPAILDDMIFYVDGGNILRAFDLSPIRDRDGDGDPDDGIRDYSLGAPYDELWEVDLGSQSSPPTAAYAPIGPGGLVVPAVFVVTASGVRGFNALEFTRTTTPTSGGPTPLPYFTEPGPLQFKQFAPNPVGGIPSPTYADGVLYAGDGYGLLHVYDFLSPSKEWCHPRADTAVTPLGIPCSPSVGYFYDPTSGATEQVAYIATHGTPGDGTIRSYPISVKNEVLTRDTNTTNNHNDPSALWFRTRNPNTYVEDTTWKLYYSQTLDDLFDAVTHFSTHQLVDTSGGTTGPTCFFKLTGPDSTIAPILNMGGNIVADYKITYTGNAGNAPAYRSIGIRHPNNATGGPISASDNKGISGSPAAGKNDILYFGTENGSIYAIKESGRGTDLFTPLTVKWRWYLGDPRVSEVLGGAFSPPVNDKIVGAPALVGDMVYFAVNDDNGQGYLLAFKADPVFSMTLDREITPGGAVTVVQPDNMTGMVGTSSPKYSAVPFTDIDKATPNTTFLLDYDTGKITFANFRPRSGTGELTTSEDMVVAYQPYDPSLAVDATPTINESHPAFATGKRDQVNNLVWFIKLVRSVGGVQTPLTATSSPMAMGDVVYLGCSQGYMCAVDVGKAADQAGGTIVPLSNGTSSGVIRKDWTDKYAWSNQVIPGVSNNDITASVAGSHGMLAVATSAGLSIMYNPVTLVADGNRLVEVNVDGTPSWTCDSTNSFHSTNAVAQSGSADKPVFGTANIPFNRPSVARKAYVGGTLVADTGNNRIVHIDKGGTAIWEIKDFVEFGATESAALGLPYPMLQPGSPMELNKPTDVTCWMTMAPMDIFDTTSQQLPVYHYLIADSGNQRVVEIVNRYDKVTRMRRNYLVQVSKEVIVPDPMDPTKTSEGRALQFRTARIAGYGANGPALIVCAVANEDSSKPDMTGSGGALIAIDWTTGNILNGTVNSLPIDAPASPLIKLINPSFYNRQMISNTEYADVVIDARGVHVLNKVGNSPPTVTVRSYLNSQHVDYDEATGDPLPITGLTSVTHPRPFLPSYAQYLPNGHVLVTNRATGSAYYKDPKTGILAVNPVTNKPQTRAFYGEIFEVQSDPSNPTGLIRSPGTSIWYKAELHQPLSAERALY